jgi:hypothetical protein
MISSHKTPARKDPEYFRASQRSRMTLRIIPTRKRAMARTRREKVSQSCAAMLMALRTKFPVRCPVKVLARMKEGV